MKERTVKFKFKEFEKNVAKVKSRKFTTHYYIQMFITQPWKTKSLKIPEFYLMNAWKSYGGADVADERISLFLQKCEGLMVDVVTGFLIWIIPYELFRQRALFDRSIYDDDVELSW